MIITHLFPIYFPGIIIYNHLIPRFVKDFPSKKIPPLVIFHCHDTGVGPPMRIPNRTVYGKKKDNWGYPHDLGNFHFQSSRFHAEVKDKKNRTPLHLL
jgi:hypothetical protein